MEQRNGNKFGRLMVPALLVHLVCCGGLLLAVMLGSVGFAAIAAFLRDPVVQAFAVAGLAGLLVLLWRRRRSAGVASPPGERSARTG